MATRRELPADFAAALDQFPAAADRFAALPAERQNEWLNWIARGRGRGARRRRIDEAVRRLSPPATAAATQEEIAEPVGPPPDRTWWIWLLLLLLLVIGGLLAWFFATRGPGKTTVPHVVGMRAQNAVATLHRKHLKDRELVGPSARPPNVVFAQTPGAGKQVNKNQTVIISVSSGPARKPVPNVVGDPVATASRKVTSKGFVPVVKHHASTKPKGIVFAQQPLAGVTAVKGTKVILSVSTGIKPVIVPSVVGETQGAAVNTLTRVHLRPVLRNVPSPKPAGQVVAQKPAAGTKVDTGSAVTLNVSSGTGTVPTTTTVKSTTTTGTTATVTTSTAPSAARVPVPRVRGLAVTAGLSRLNSAGFRPVVRYVTSTRRAGLIVAESPAGGTAPFGSRVRVSVSEGPNPAQLTSVPNVVGQDQATAGTTLRQAGFKVLVLFRKTTNQSQDGLVIDEQPVAGSQIPRGSVVAIFVGRFSG
jgi:beta-lactam-binding protein with PASTA domain